MYQHGGVVKRVDEYKSNPFLAQVNAVLLRVCVNYTDENLTFSSISFTEHPSGGDSESIDETTDNCSQKSPSATNVRYKLHGRSYCGLIDQRNVRSKDLKLESCAYMCTRLSRCAGFTYENGGQEVYCYIHLIIDTWANQLTDQNVECYIRERCNVGKFI